VLGLLLIVLLGAQTLNRQWSTDYWMYTATVDALASDLGDPPHDMVGTDDPSERFTPYTVGLAVVVRETGLASVTVLQLAGFLNLIVFLVAFELFVTELTRRRLVAFFALLATLVMWGFIPWRWSGYLNLNSIGFGLPWPATLVTAIALLAGWALLRYDKSGAVGWLVLVGLGMAFGALSHPYTAGWASVMLLAIVVHRRLYRRDRIVPLAIMGLGTVALVVAWPYYPFLELGTRGDEAYSAAMHVMYDRAPLRVLAALPGFVVVFQRFRRDRTDVLGLMLFGGLAIYLLGAVADQRSFGRVLPLIMLAAHIGIGILVADFVERRRPVSIPWIAWLAVSVIIGLVGVAPGLVRTVPRALLPSTLRDRTELQPITARYERLDHALPSGTVIVAEPERALNLIAPAFDLELVAPGYPSAFVKHLDQRTADARAFLAPSTSEAARRAIADRYDVEAVLCATKRCAQTFAAGDEVAHGPGWTLIRVPSAA
jgi:hypothetical protein